METNDQVGCLNELFRDTHQIHELTNQFQEQSRSIQEISMNAAIAAGQAGEHIRVFSEMAKQIGHISTMMIEALTEIRTYTTRMTNRMLECLVKSSQQQKFIEIKSLDASPEIRAHSERVVADFGSMISNLLDTTHSDLQVVRSHQKKLLLVNERIWSIAMNLKVSASFIDSDEKTFFLSIAESLEQMNGKSTEIVENFTDVMRSVDRRLVERCGCLIGESYASKSDL